LIPGIPLHQTFTLFAVPFIQLHYFSVKSITIFTKTTQLISALYIRLGTSNIPIGPFPMSACPRTPPFRTTHSTKNTTTNTINRLVYFTPINRFAFSNETTIPITDTTFLTHGSTIHPASTAGLSARHLP
jgi:hypothetical protein